MGIISALFRGKTNKMAKSPDQPASPRPLPAVRPGYVRLSAVITARPGPVCNPVGFRVNAGAPDRGPLNIVKRYNAKRRFAPF